VWMELHMWCDVRVYGGLNTSSERTKRTGYLPAETLSWLGQRARAGVRRHGKSVSDMTCALVALRLNGRWIRLFGRNKLEENVRLVPAWRNRTINDDDDLYSQFLKMKIERNFLKEGSNGGKLEQKYG
jgi:hypothetical protein